MRELYGVSRIAGLDVGERRIGIAVSDASGTLASPVGVIEVTGLGPAAVAGVARQIEALEADDDRVETVVVGLPRNLDGSASAMTARVDAFATRLGARLRRPIVRQDERLSSREAEERLAAREKDWRARKKKLDAAAAAVILQDYLDTRAVCRPIAGGTGER
jgi:putative Holliday junction resolvase